MIILKKVGNMIIAVVRLCMYLGWCCTSGIGGALKAYRVHAAAPSLYGKSSKASLVFLQCDIKEYHVYMDIWIYGYTDIWMIHHGVILYSGDFLKYLFAAYSHGKDGISWVLYADRKTSG